MTAASEEFEAACESRRAALRQNPDDPVAHSDLAVILCLRGDYPQALEHARRATEIAPGMTVAYVNGAVIAGCLGDYQDALPWLDAALAIDPQHLPALLLRANTLAKLDRSDEAIAICERALQADPDTGQVWEMLAVALAAARRYEEALAAFERAASCSPAGTIGVRKAMLLLELGRRELALATLDGVLSNDPDLAVAWYTRALAKDFALDAQEIASIERLLSGERSLTFNDRIQLEFALGRSYLALGETAKAFSHLAAGNEHKRSSIRYDVGDDERHVETLIERFSAPFMAQARGSGYRSELPVFVIGMPRSGTSLIEQILASHPAVFGAGELTGIMPQAELEPERLRAAGQEYVEMVSRLAPGFERVVDKAPLNFLHAGLIHLMIPGARIIHCRRDALDTCFSCYLTLFDRHLGFSYDLRELGRFYRSYVRLMEHWRAVLPAERFIEVRYEDVVGDLESQAQRLVAFCGLEWDPRCLAFHKTARPVSTASMNQVRKPLYATSIGRAQSLRPYLVPLAQALDTL